MEVKKGLCMLAMIVITTLIVFLLVLIITNKSNENYDDAKSVYCRFTDTCKGTRCKRCDEFEYAIQNKCPREIGASMGVDGTLGWTCVRSKECYSSAVERGKFPRYGPPRTCTDLGEAIYAKCCGERDLVDDSSNNKCINYNERSYGEDVICCDGSHLDNFVCKTKCSALTSCDMGSGVDKKVIVIRHGCDVTHDWNPGYYNAQLPSGDRKQYGLQGLSDLGCKQAYALSVALPKFIKDMGYAPVTKVSVQDPHPDGETSNPFRTVFNFIQSCNIKDVEFVDTKTGGINSVPVNTDTTTGSLLYCYTSQVINGPNKIQNNPEEDSILYKLMNKFNIQSTIYSPPWKGYTIYVFSKGELKYFHLDVDSQKIKSGDGFDGHKPC